MICVPWILWSAFTFAANLPLPDFIPGFHYHINDYLLFESNPATITAAVYLAYYYVLEPFAAVNSLFDT